MSYNFVLTNSCAEKPAILRKAIHDTGLEGMPILYRLLFECRFEMESDLRRLTVDKMLVILTGKKNSSTIDTINTKRAVRILGNVLACYEETVGYFVEEIKSGEGDLKGVSNMLNALILDGSVPTNELLWLAGLVWNSKMESVQSYLITDNLVVNLRVIQ